MNHCATSRRTLSADVRSAQNDEPVMGSSATLGSSSSRIHLARTDRRTSLARDLAGGEPSHGEMHCSALSPQDEGTTRLRHRPGTGLTHGDLLRASPRRPAWGAKTSSCAADEVCSCTGRGHVVFVLVLWDGTRGRGVGDLVPYRCDELWTRWTRYVIRSHNGLHGEELMGPIPPTFLLPYGSALDKAIS